MRCFAVLYIAGGVALTGCASSSSEMSGAYLPPSQYENLSCPLIEAQADRVSRRVTEPSSVQDSKSTSDAVATGVAAVIIWPAAGMINGDGQTGAELARLKGEFEALEHESIRRHCNIRFERRTVAVAAG